jgi:hypothetical protein
MLAVDKNENNGTKAKREDTMTTAFIAFTPCCHVCFGG